MSESTQWEMTSITITRRAAARRIEGAIIPETAVIKLWDAMVDLAFEKGFTISGILRPTRTNCPHCGRIVRSPKLERCAMCGFNFTTGKVT